MNAVVASATGITWRKLNDQEKAAYGPHSMVIGFAECCPYCHTKELRVASDSGDPNSLYAYLEVHKPHHEDEGAGYTLCPVSESFVHELNSWMQGDKHSHIGVYVAKMSYAEFTAKRFPSAL